MQNLKLKSIPNVGLNVDYFILSYYLPCSLYFLYILCLVPIQIFLFDTLLLNYLIYMYIIVFCVIFFLATNKLKRKKIPQ